MAAKPNEESDSQQSSASLSNWLDNIQQNSWELELLISGFAIFLLLGAAEPVRAWEQDILVLGLESNYALLLVTIYYPILTALQVLTVCLIGHVLLRGLWIAAIGLRYVSGDIDYEELKYNERFKSFLEKRIGDFDRYIERLERACSVAFSIAFLIIFALISLASFAFVSVVLQILLRLVLGMQWQGTAVFGGDDIFGLLILVLGLLYFIDFASIGFFKRKNWAKRWYYPLYRFMGWVSLARIYRPLYHNLVDNRFGRRLGRSLPLVLLLTLITASFTYVKSPYFDVRAGEANSIRAAQYDDLKQGTNWSSVWQVSLDSRYVGQDGYVEVFVPYVSREQDPVIEYKFPDLEPGRYAGIKLDGAFTIGEKYNYDANTDSLLMALGSLHRIYLNDSLVSDANWRFYAHPERRQNGLIYFMPLHEETTGEHQIRVDRQWLSRADTLYWVDGRIINVYR